MLYIRLISCTYFCSNMEIQKPILDLKKKRFKIYPAVIEMLTALQHVTYLSSLSLKHITQFINLILSVYLKCSLTLQSKKGTKTSNRMATICLGQIIQVIQNEVVFVTLGVCIVKSLNFNECITVFELTICNSQFAKYFGSLRMSFCSFSLLGNC